MNLIFSANICKIGTPIIELFTRLHSATIGATNKTKLITLYPYNYRKIEIIFFYGDDYKRRVGPPPLLDIVSDYWFIPLWFIVASFVLHLIRKKTRQERPIISSTFLDMIIIFFGGGNVRHRHKFEGSFILILLFGMFLMQAIWVSDFLSKMSNVRSQNSVRTLEKLAELNKPIYLSNNVLEQRENIIQLLRFSFALFV